jgi:hypothetical protein
VLVLWLGVALVAAVLVVLLLRDRTGPRDDVAAYIDRVNATSIAQAKSYKTIELAYRRFALAPGKPARQEAALRAAAASMTTQRQRFERIPAPKDARKLKQLLLVFFRREEAVSRQLIGASTYVPRLSAAEKPLAAANDRMRAVLDAGGTAAEQAAALDTYASALGRAARAVAAIDPPPLFRPVHAEQVTRLRRAGQLMRRLATALTENDRPTLNRTVEQLAQATGGSNAVARQAIVSYNDRVADVREAAVAAERERLRLNQQLG